MKAVVVEIREGFAALMREDGIVIKVKNVDFQIGDVVKLKEHKSRQRGRFVAMIAAAAMFLILIGGSTFAYTIPSYYVSFDVNPGILMTVNMFERVIGIEAANEDADEFLKGLDLKNRNIGNAISMAVERVAKLGYFDEESGNVLIAATAKNTEKAEKLTRRLQNAAETEIIKTGSEAVITAETIDYEMVQAAKAVEGMTPGKYNIVVNLLGKDAVDYSETSINDIMNEYKATKGTEGKERAEEAIGKERANGKHEEPAQNENRDKQDSATKAEQAGNKERNVPQGNLPSGKDDEETKGNEPSEKPRIPVVPGKPDKIETPGKSDKPESPGKSDKPDKPKTPKVPAVRKP